MVFFWNISSTIAWNYFFLSIFIVQLNFTESCTESMLFYSASTNNGKRQRCKVRNNRRYRLFYIIIKNNLNIGDIYYFIYPLFHSKSDSSPIKYVQLMSLEFLGELVKNTDTETLKMFLSTELMDICINILEKPRKLSKIVCFFNLLLINE